MELAKYIKGVREFHREMGYPIRDYTVELMVDAWHKATKAERERCAEIADAHCHCEEHYTERDLIDPTCDCHDIAAEIREADDG